MHLFDVVTVFVVLTLVGVEFSVSAFVNPAAWRLEPGAQLQVLSRLALVLGKVMPVWYPLCTLLLLVETWVHWSGLERGLLIAAAAVWAVASVASIFLLVPLNSRIAEGAADWQRIHRVWDKRHRVRIVALGVAGFLLTYALVR